MGGYGSAAPRGLRRPMTLDRLFLHLSSLMAQSLCDIYRLLRIAGFACQKNGSIFKPHSITGRAKLISAFNNKTALSDHHGLFCEIFDFGTNDTLTT